MSQRIEKTIIGLLHTVIERVDALENRLVAKGGAAVRDEPRRWTPKDVERKFGIGIRQQYNLRAKGLLPYIQKTPNGPITYLPADILDYFFGDCDSQTIS